jgi:hypothetical protein
MNKSGLVFLLAFTITFQSFGQNPFWVRIDKKQFYNLNQIDKSKPKDVETHFIKHTKNKQVKQQLGFGWSVWKSNLPGGYVSVQGVFFYYKDTLVSYLLSSRLPSEHKLIDKYTTWAKGTFKVDSNKIIPYEFQRENLLRPLQEYNGSFKPDNLSEDILEYMSPNSGTMYGYYGGIANEELQNRQYFNSIKNKLTVDEVYAIMYSINPASRLTAVEYYKRNLDKFENKKIFEDRIKIIYKETPLVSTFIGCIGEIWESGRLVDFCLQIKEQD